MNHDVAVGAAVLGHVGLGHHWPANLVLGALSFVFDLSNVIDIGGLSVSAAVAIVGITFVCLRRRGHLKFFPEE